MFSAAKRTRFRIKNRVKKMGIRRYEGIWEIWEIFTHASILSPQSPWFPHLLLSSPFTLHPSPFTLHLRWHSPLTIDLKPNPDTRPATSISRITQLICIIPCWSWIVGLNGIGIRPSDEDTLTCQGLMLWCKKYGHTSYREKSPCLLYLIAWNMDGFFSFSSYFWVYLFY